METQVDSVEKWTELTKYTTTVIIRLMWIQSKSRVGQFSLKACINESMMGETAKYKSKFSKLKVSCHHLPEEASGLQGY